jgi:hypothetical protein
VTHKRHSDLTFPFFVTAGLNGNGMLCREWDKHGIIFPKNKIVRFIIDRLSMCSKTLEMDLERTIEVMSNYSFYPQGWATASSCKEGQEPFNFMLKEFNMTMTGHNPDLIKHMHHAKFIESLFDKFTCTVVIRLLKSRRILEIFSLNDMSWRGVKEIMNMALPLINFPYKLDKHLHEGMVVDIEKAQTVQKGN